MRNGVRYYYVYLYEKNLVRLRLFGKAISSQLILRTEKKISYMHRFYAFVVSSCKLIRS